MVPRLLVPAEGQIPQHHAGAMSYAVALGPGMVHASGQLRVHHGHNSRPALGFQPPLYLLAGLDLFQAYFREIGLSAPIAAMGLEHQTAVLLLPGPDQGAGPHRGEAETFRPQLGEQFLGHDEDRDQFVEQQREGPLGGDADAPLVQGLDGGDVYEIGPEGRGRILHGPLQGEDHILGRQRAAVVEHHAGPEVEDPGIGIRRLPVLGQQGHDPHPVVELHQPLVDIGLHH